MAESSVTRETRWGTELAYTYGVARCLCYAQRPSVLRAVNAHGTRAPLGGTARVHHIWVAFLRYSNDEYEQERCMRDYLLLPMNWLTTTLTGRPWIHCQLVFWDEIRKQYYTFSVDNKRPVHVFDKKTFAAGWDFIELGVTEQQEVAVHNFLVAQLGKPLNTAGQSSYIFGMPISGAGQAWFCSELVTAALDSAGLVDYSAWPGVKAPAAAAMHDIYDYLTKHCTTCDVVPLAMNPVSVASVHRQAASRGKIAIAVDALPPSIVAHATSSTAPLLATDLSEQLAAMPSRSAPAASPLDYFVIKR